MEGGETALVFLGGEQSHAFTKGPMLPPAGERPVFDPSGTYAEESLTAADPDFELWDVGHAALDAAAAHLEISATDLLYARVDVIGGPDNPLLLELELVEPSLGWRQVDRATRDLRSGSSRSASSQRWTGSGSVRSRIDAHSAEVAAVHAAAPATWIATSAAGTPMAYWTRPTRACAATRISKTTSRLMTRRSALILRSAKPSPSSSAR